MPLCVVGSVAFDTVETPHGKAERCLGGSAVYFSVAAHLLNPVNLVGVVGEDFGQNHIDTLSRPGIDLTGLQRKKGKTFFWWGRYSDDMNDRETMEVDLNVFGEFEPVIPESYRNSRYVFLANGSPATQATVLDQIPEPKLTMVDTMDLWIETTRPELEALLRRVDALIINDSEARLLSGETNLIKAARSVLEMGPDILIVKKGEHGVMMLTEDDFFAIPAYPCERVMDPTGAGDTFAGGLMGYLASVDRVDAAAIKTALAYGTVLASFSVEDFSLRRLLSISLEDVEARLSDLRGMLKF